MLQFLIFDFEQEQLVIWKDSAVLVLDKCLQYGVDFVNWI